MIILFDLVVPCIIYYAWFDVHKVQWERRCREHEGHSAPCQLDKPEFDRHILGYAVISFGIGELYILIVRVFRLLRFKEDCAPLLSRSKWELDATSWVYGVSMLYALVPFVVGSSEDIPKLYLYAPGALMAFLGILMLVTMVPFKIPIGIDSQARETPVRPFVYYACEDFIAVDGLQDRGFRIRYNIRYGRSKPFRRMMFNLTLWWFLGICIYLGCLSSIIWLSAFHVAFRLSFGILFAWIIIWITLSCVYVKFEIERQGRDAVEQF